MKSSDFLPITGTDIHTHILFCIINFQLKEFANFDFDVWRKKYMRWMNHKKSRVMDFFRRIDKDQDGKITRQEFIDGILASSRLLVKICLVVGITCFDLKTLNDIWIPVVHLCRVSHQ